LGLPSQTTQAISDGNWAFLKLLPVRTHTIYFKGDLKGFKATATGGSNVNHTFAGPYGWDISGLYVKSLTKEALIAGLLVGIFSGIFMVEYTNHFGALTSSLFNIQYLVHCMSLCRVSIIALPVEWKI